jgi:hypothetical protein
MRSLTRVLGLLALCFIAAQGQTGKPALSRLGWLAGYWENETGNQIYTEQWMIPAGTSMLGASRTVAGGKTVAYEFLQIRRDEQGDIFYVARPSGQAEAAFRLVKHSDRELVFENPTHDFPQRIIYRLQEASSPLHQTPDFCTAHGRRQAGAQVVEKTLILSSEVRLPF